MFLFYDIGGSVIIYSQPDPPIHRHSARTKPGVLSKKSPGAILDAAARDSIHLASSRANSWPACDLHALVPLYGVTCIYIHLTATLAANLLLADYSICEI